MKEATAWYSWYAKALSLTDIRKTYKQKYFKVFIFFIFFIALSSVGKTLILKFFLLKSRLRLDSKSEWESDDFL